MSEEKELSLNEYQRNAVTTDKYPKDLKGDLCVALGLVSESGEIAGAMRRIVRDDAEVITQERKGALMAELGDILWYVATLSDRLGFPLDRVASYNIAKLKDRARRGKIKGEGDNR
tara:strand:- start:205 stop:552 length:348 start_codon:yes stop_codon:yes gene_type:complete